MQVKKLNDQAELIHGRAEDAGYDLRAIESVVIRPGQAVKIQTGLSLAIPDGHFGMICDRSSIGSKGLKVMGGIVDQVYRGEVIVCLCNLNQGGDENAYQISPGDKIAQLILIPYIKPEIEYVDSLTDTERGDKGFGSSGT